jgi:hypothetical protein
LTFGKENQESMTTPETSAADGCWERLNTLEDAARNRISAQMQPFDDAFRLTYEAGVIVPVLRANGLGTLDVRCAALFFKRSLNDLRVVHNLLLTGYTSQAASVAAALYENALATTCLTHSQSNIDALLNAENGELPWGAMQMTKMIAVAEGKKEGSVDYENSWRSLYAHYVWLCQCKHPTMQTVLHDVSATQLDEGYVVMALPNAKEQDMSYKAMVAIHTLMRVHESIEAFARVLGYPDSDTWPDDHRFSERFKNARRVSWDAFSPFLKAPNPVSIAGSKFVKKYPPVK